MKTTIRHLTALEILDSRGNPTLEVEVHLEGGAWGVASVPSGASKGAHEALEVRDGDPARYGGLGVLVAAGHVTGEISRALVGRDALDQATIDATLIAADGTPHRSHLGANALVGVSLAVARAAADARNLPLFQYLGGSTATRLPCPMFNVLNGGVHANGQGPDVQEFMVCPVGAPTFAEGLRWAAEVYQTLKVLLKQRGFPTGVGDEGGFILPVKSNSEALDLLVEAIATAGYRPGTDLALAIDPASSGFYNPETKLYQLKTEDRFLTSAELIALYVEWVDRYPLILVEDGLAEDDWEGWSVLTQTLGHRIELVGDDLFVTNATRLDRGLAEASANAILIKPNQAGTLTETVAVMKKAKLAGWGTMVSHRSGETVDPFIADLAVGLDAGHLKSGAPCRGERLAKYNRLVKIEALLGKAATYAGGQGFVRPSPAAEAKGQHSKKDGNKP